MSDTRHTTLARWVILPIVLAMPVGFGILLVLQSLAARRLKPSLDGFEAFFPLHVNTPELTISLKKLVPGGSVHAWVNDSPAGTWHTPDDASSQEVLISLPPHSDSHSILLQQTGTAVLRTVRGARYRYPPVVCDTAPPAVGTPRVSCSSVLTNEAVVAVQVTVDSVEEDGLVLATVANNKMVGSVRVLLTRAGYSGLQVVALREGYNTVEAVVTDSAGNEVRSPDAVSIVLDKTPPRLYFDPIPFFYGGRAPVSGVTEPGATLTANGRRIKVGMDGRFDAKVHVDIPCWVELRASDKAGNVSARRQRVVHRSSPFESDYDEMQSRLDDLEYELEEKSDLIEELESDLEDLQWELNE